MAIQHRVRDLTQPIDQNGASSCKIFKAPIQITGSGLSFVLPFDLVDLPPSPFDEIVIPFHDLVEFLPQLRRHPLALHHQLHKTFKLTRPAALRFYGRAAGYRRLRLRRRSGNRLTLARASSGRECGARRFRSD